MVSSQNFRVKCKNLVFCTCKVEIYNLIYPVLLRGYVKCKNLVFCTRKVEIYHLIYPVLLRGYL
ncbi:hypothetical protein MSIBF_A2600006 [groundwater metagenome]|uniref:Uncharacterized protein n=1 Tax=groundwater metagenome TaxID=717931 RepID=A0A098EAX8_9ZZZZ